MTIQACHQQPATSELSQSFLGRPETVLTPATFALINVFKLIQILTAVDSYITTTTDVLSGTRW